MEASWKVLTSNEQVDRVVKDSFTSPQVIFKHSIRCSLSESIYNHLNEWNKDQQVLTIHYLDIINYRPVSNYIEALFGILHESPQIILLQQGKVQYHESHYRIKGDKLEEEVNEPTLK